MTIAKCKACDKQTPERHILWNGNHLCNEECLAQYALIYLDANWVRQPEEEDRHG